MKSITEALKRAYAQIDVVTQPLSVFGFREAAKENCGDVEDSSHGMREFVLPHSESSVLVGFTVEKRESGDYVSYAVGRRCESQRSFGYRHETAGVLGIEKSVGRNAQGVLQEAGLFNENALALSKIYAWLENEGYILQPVERAKPFVFKSENGNEVKIRREITFEKDDPYYGDIDIEVVGGLMVDEFEKDNPEAVFSTTIPEYVKLRVERNEAAIASPLVQIGVLCF